MQKESRINVLLLSIGAIAGNLRHMLDIIEHINPNRFNMFITYKPASNRWTPEDLEYVQSHNVSVYPLRGKHLFSLYGLIDLAKVIMKESIDIIHCFDSFGMIARAIGKLFRCKIIQHVGNTPDHHFTKLSKTYIFNFLTSFLLDGATFCGHEVQKSNLLHHFVHWNGVNQVVIHDCVDTQNIDINIDTLTRKRKYGISPDAYVLTNTGYFNEQKGQSFLIQSFQKIRKKRQDVTLVIIGWGYLEEELKNLAIEMDLQESIVFTGKLNRDKVYEILSFTDIFVLSSLWEGFGIVTVEAMAHSIPVVATDTDGSREVLVDGRTGILVPSHDPVPMAEAILSLLEQPELMSRMGLTGKTRVIEYFNPEQFISKHESFYCQLLGRKHISE